MQTWNYTGTMMTGTDTSVIYTPAGPVFTTTPLFEGFTAQLVINTDSIFYTINIGSQTITGTAAGTNGWALGPGFIQPVTNGFDVSVQDADYGQSFASFEFSPQSESYSFSNLNSTISLSGGSGTWVDPITAPELNFSEFNFFLLLAGGLAVIRGRKFS
jgi:hypothetical protein